MKTAVLPHVRVEPEFRDAIEGLLRDDESLTGFIEAAVRQAVREREFRNALAAEAAESWEEYERDLLGYTAEEVAADLRKDGSRIIEERFGKRTRKAAG